jgi:hypothetical protein
MNDKGRLRLSTAHCPPPTALRPNTEENEVAWTGLRSPGADGPGINLAKPGG